MNTTTPFSSRLVAVDQRNAAISRLAERRHRRFLLYVGVLAAANAVVLAFWAVLALAGHSDLVRIRVWPGQPPLPSGFFWPIFPIAICAVLVLLSARRAYPSGGYPADEIEAEMERTSTSRAASVAERPAPTRPTDVDARRRGFRVHLAVYLAINTVVVLSWALGGGGFFWPVFLMVVWGVGVLVNGVQAYRPGGR